MPNAEADALVLRHRLATDRLLEPAQNQARVQFLDPGPDNPVLTEDFLSHLDLDLPAIDAVLRDAFPYLDRVPGLKRELHARLHFRAWMTIRGHRQLASAHRALMAEPGAVRKLGFAKPPEYETLRHTLNDRLTPTRIERIKTILLQEEKRLLPDLGQTQVEDATPSEARRRDEAAPFNPHYRVRMQKLEARWDAARDALLADQFYHGTAHEGRWLDALTRRLEAVDLHADALIVDGAYTSFQTIASQWRRGTQYLFRIQEGWVVNEAEARRDVEKRVRKHWRHDGFPVEGSWQDRLRFLYDRGTAADREAVGRWVRDATLAGLTEEDEAIIGFGRSRNEALNGDLKRLPFSPASKGAREMLRRVQACTLTLHMVQLTRIQNGVKQHLCRTAYLV